jgi:tetratricopeptide (TPR) repeat protein
LEHQEQPEHPFTLFNLGMTYADQGDHEKAVAFLEQSIAHAEPGESHLRKAYALLVFSLAQLDRKEQARDICERGLERFPEDAELRFRRAILLHESGSLAEAARLYEDLFATTERRHFSSLDRGITGFKARQNLALVYQDMGEWANAEKQWRLITKEMPCYRAGWRGLADVLIRQQRYSEALALASELHADSRLASESLLVEGQVAVARGHTAKARRALEQAIKERPADPEPRRVLCQLLFEHAEPEEAAAALRELVQLEPKDASAHFNLGTVCLRLERFDDAIAAYRRSLEYRPNWVPTYLQLANALQQAGQVEEAVDTWQEVLRLDPRNGEAEEALKGTAKMAS